MQSQPIVIIFGLLLYVPSFLWSLLSLGIIMKTNQEPVEYLRARGEDPTKPYIEPFTALGLLLILIPLVNTFTALLGAWAIYNQYVRVEKTNVKPGAVPCR